MDCWEKQLNSFSPAPVMTPKPALLILSAREGKEMRKT